MGLGVGSSAMGIEVAAGIVAAVVGGMASPVKGQTNTRAGSGEGRDRGRRHWRRRECRGRDRGGGGLKEIAAGGGGDEWGTAD
jgi:hypothetical protein